MSLHLSKLIFVLVWLALVLLVRLAIKRRSYPYPLPPSPKSLPLIGNLLQMPESHRWLHFYRWSRDTYGPIMYLNLGGLSMIVLSTHEAAMDLLVKRGAHYSDRPRFVVAGDMVTKGMHQLLRQYDSAYRLHQRLEAPLLSVQASEHYQPVQELESRQLLLDLMKSCDEEGERGVEFYHFFDRKDLSYSLFSPLYCRQTSNVAFSYHLIVSYRHRREYYLLSPVRL